MFAQALRDFKSSTILVYMTINGKGGLTGGGQHGYSLASVPMWLSVLNKAFWLFPQVMLFVYFVVCVYYILQTSSVSGWVDGRADIKCQRMGGWSCRHQV